MKVLVAYMSMTGNTKKVAEAIHGVIKADKEIKRIQDVEDIGAYDLAFLGFPVHGYGPDKKTKQLISTHCTKGRKVALFVTHAAPEADPENIQVMDKFKKEAAAADLVGFFDCQGQLSAGTKFIMHFMSKKVRNDAKRDSSKGQPDETRLEKARVFARDTMSRVG